MRFLITPKQDPCQISASCESINEVLMFANIESWGLAQTRELYDLVDKTNDAIKVIGEHGISNESLKMIDCTDEIIVALNKENPVTALEGQASEIWAKVVAFFKELWKRITDAFKVLLGRLDKESVTETLTVIKESDKVDEVLKQDWGRSIYKIYTPQALGQLKKDIFECISFVKYCRELDLKQVVSTDVEEYTKFEEEFVKRANAIFGTTVNLTKENDELSFSRFLPFSKTVLSNDSKKIKARFEFSSSRGIQALPNVPKTEHGYRSAQDFVDLCGYQQEFMEYFGSITSIISGVNDHIDEYLAVLEESVLKIIPPTTISKVRELLKQIPYSCTECNKQVYEVIRTCSKMIAVINKQLTTSSTSTAN